MSTIKPLLRRLLRSPVGGSTVRLARSISRQQEFLDSIRVRLEADVASAGAELIHIYDLPTRARRGMERLVAYCPQGCRVVTVYGRAKGALLELAGEIYVTEGTGILDVPQGIEQSQNLDDFIAHPARWLERDSIEKVWVVNCRKGHGAYPVSKQRIITICDTVTKPRQTIGVSQLAPGTR